MRGFQQDAFDTSAFQTPGAPLTIESINNLFNQRIPEMVQAVLLSLTDAVLPVNVSHINGKAVKGSGQDGDPWGPM